MTRPLSEKQFAAVRQNLDNGRTDHHRNIVTQTAKALQEQFPDAFPTWGKAIAEAERMRAR